MENRGTGNHERAVSRTEDLFGPVERLFPADGIAGLAGRGQAAQNHDHETLDRVGRHRLAYPRDGRGQTVWMNWIM